MNNEHLATYYINGETFYIYACYDTEYQFDNGEPSFYDIHDNNGACINEGDPLEFMPDYDYVSEYIKQ